MSTTPIIQITKLCKSFNGRNVLNNVNLRINEGESVVIVGPSGSGKSVLIKHLIGFWQPDSGTVEIDGKNWADLNAGERETLRQQFGMVFQRDALFDNYTIEENVRFPLEIRRDIHLTPEEIQERVENFLTRVGLHEYADSRPVEISGGMQKRVGLARALALAPKIILYDEPTTGLDPSTGKTISQLIHQVNQEHPDVTSVTITHDYYCAALVAERMFLLNKRERTLQEITADILTIKAEAQSEDEELKKIEEYVKAKLEESKRVESHVAKLSTESFRLFSYLGDGVKYVCSLIGQLFFLFLSMGFPLRAREFTDRFFTLGIFSFPMVFAAGFFVGMIGIIQFYVGIGGNLDFLPIPLPLTFARALVKILAPLLVGVLLAGRVGSHIAAEIGTKQFNNQINALEFFAISPKRYLLSPIVLALALTTPAMSLLAALGGILGGYCMWLSFGQSGSLFLYYALSAEVLNAYDILYVVSKSIVIGIFVGLAGYQQGIEEKKSAEDIANATKNAVLIASILVIMFDFLMNYIHAQYLH